MPQNIRIDFRPILASKDFPMAAYGRVEKALEDFLKKDAAPRVKKEMESATRTWKHKPEFPVEFRYLQYKMWAQVAPQGPNRDKWKFVSRGTRIRHARMSDDFIAKTRPGSLRSGSGRGHVVAVSRKIMKPGIEARQFEEQIIEKHGSKLRADANAVVGKALKQVF